MSPEQIRIYRAMPPAKKLEIAAQFYFEARRLKTRALSHQHPEWSDPEIEQHVRELFLRAR